MDGRQRDGRDAIDMVGVLTTVLDILGLAAVVVGLGLIYMPLWFVGGGAAALILSWRLS